jgi:hypothetical protein
LPTADPVGAIDRHRVELGIVVAVNAALVVAVVEGWWAFAVAALAVVPLTLVLAVRPQRGVLVLAAVVPFNGLLLILPHPSLLAGWKEALTLAVLAATFVAPPAARGAAGRRPPPWFAAAVGLVLIGAISALAVAHKQGLEGMKVSFFYLLIALAIWRCPLSSRERDWLVTILVVDGIITAGFGLVQEVLGPARLNALGYQYNTTIRTAGGHLRAFSTFNQPFPFAFFLMVVVLVVLPTALRDPHRWRNRAFLIALPFIGIALATTIVRAAWLGLAVGLIYLGIERYRRLLLVIPAAALVLVLLPPSLTSSAVSGTSAQQRATGWRANLTRLEQHPLGVGIGATGSAAEKLAGTATTSATSATATYQPDDYYVKTLLELGIPGLWLLVLLLGSAFVSTRRLARRPDPEESDFGCGVAAAVLAAATAATTATYFEIFPVDVLFWLLLGVAATIAAEPAGTVRPPSMDLVRVGG